MHPLDNVIWQALNSRQAHLGERHQQAAKFHKDINLLGGFAEPPREGYDSLSVLLDPGERAGLFLEAPPQPPRGWTVVAHVPLLQMLRENDAAPSPTNNAQVVQLGEPDVPDMLALTKLTKPGPFAKRTREMGDYFGIHVNRELIAMAGERLRLPGYTEISAVCTHPEHLGHGYATTLVTLLMQRIQSRGEQPFLHVRADNARAVALYERLGFRKRPPLHYAIISKGT